MQFLYDRRRDILSIHLRDGTSTKIVRVACDANAAVSADEELLSITLTKATSHLERAALERIPETLATFREPARAVAEVLPVSYGHRRQREHVVQFQIERIDNILEPRNSRIYLVTPENNKWRVHDLVPRGPRLVRSAVESPRAEYRIFVDAEGNRRVYGFVPNERREATVPHLERQWQQAVPIVEP